MADFKTTRNKKNSFYILAILQVIKRSLHDIHENRCTYVLNISLSLQTPSTMSRISDSGRLFL